MLYCGRRATYRLRPTFPPGKYPWITKKTIQEMKCAKVRLEALNYEGNSITIGRDFLPGQLYRFKNDDLERSYREYYSLINGTNPNKPLSEDERIADWKGFCSEFDANYRGFMTIVIKAYTVYVIKIFGWQLPGRANNSSPETIGEVIWCLEDVAAWDDTRKVQAYHIMFDIFKEPHNVWLVDHVRNYTSLILKLRVINNTNRHNAPARFGTWYSRAKACAQETHRKFRDKMLTFHNETVAHHRDSTGKLDTLPMPSSKKTPGGYILRKKNLPPTIVPNASQPLSSPTASTTPTVMPTILYPHMKTNHHRPVQQPAPFQLLLSHYLQKEEPQMSPAITPSPILATPSPILARLPKYQQQSPQQAKIPPPPYHGMASPGNNVAAAALFSERRPPLDQIKFQTTPAAAPLGPVHMASPVNTLAAASALLSERRPPMDQIKFQTTPAAALLDPVQAKVPPPYRDMASPVNNVAACLSKRKPQQDQIHFQAPPAAAWQRVLHDSLAGKAKTPTKPTIMPPDMNVPEPLTKPTITQPVMNLPQLQAASANTIKRTNDGALPLFTQMHTLSKEAKQDDFVPCQTMAKEVKAPRITFNIELVRNPPKERPTPIIPAEVDRKTK